MYNNVYNKRRGTRSICDRRNSHAVPTCDFYYRNEKPTTAPSSQLDSVPERLKTLAIFFSTWTIFHQSAGTFFHLEPSGVQTVDAVKSYIT